MRRNKVRQEGKTLNDIAIDHRARYEFAIQHLNKDHAVIDVGCGIGYGSSMMIDHARYVLALEIDPEAKAIYDVYYKRSNIDFILADLTDPSVRFGSFDVAVAFEFIEHVEDPSPIIEKVSQSVNKFICSVPNENVWAWEPRLLPKHYRHYTPNQFIELLAPHFKKVELYSQKDKKDVTVNKGSNGLHLIAVCSNE